jgi:hypothetical protein
VILPLPLLVVGRIHGCLRATRFSERGPEIASGAWVMSDVIFVAVTVVFFAIAVWYLDGCQALIKGGPNA